MENFLKFTFPFRMSLYLHLTLESPLFLSDTHTHTHTYTHTQTHTHINDLQILNRNSLQLRVKSPLWTRFWCYLTLIKQLNLNFLIYKIRDLTQIVFKWLFMESRGSLEVTRDNTGDEGELTHTHTHTHSHTHTLTVIISGGFHNFTRKCLLGIWQYLTCGPLCGWVGSHGWFGSMWPKTFCRSLSYQSIQLPMQYSSKLSLFFCHGNQQHWDGGCFIHGCPGVELWPEPKPIYVRHTAWTRKAFS